MLSACNLTALQNRPSACVPLSRLFACFDVRCGKGNEECFFLAILSLPQQNEVARQVVSAVGAGRYGRRIVGVPRSENER